MPDHRSQPEPDRARVRAGQGGGGQRQKNGREATVRVSGRNLDIGEALRTQAMDGVHEALGKYFGGGYAGHVSVGKDGSAFRADCVVHLDTGDTMQVSATAQDPYASVGQMVARIAKQLRRDKRRRIGRQSPGGDSRRLNGEADTTADGDSGQPEIAEAGEMAYRSASPIVAEGAADLAALTLEEAVATLEQAGEAMLAFTNAGTGRVNVIRMRPDGAIGWHDPGAPRRSRTSGTEKATRGR
jgi:ribosomal subunit interface protein